MCPNMSLPPLAGNSKSLFPHPQAFVAWRCSDVQAWGCGTSIIPMLGHPQAQSLGMWDIHHPHAWISPSPKLGDVGHPIPHSWTSPSLLPSLGMCVGYGGEGIICVGSSTKHHFIELERKKTSVLGGYHKTLNLKNQGWVGIRKWETHRSKNLA